MKIVSESENEFRQFVVNMVGCVTIREPFLLVLEYVKYGDLLKYLRAMRNQVSNNFKHKMMSCSSLYSEHFIAVHVL